MQKTKTAYFHKNVRFIIAWIRCWLKQMFNFTLKLGIHKGLDLHNLIFCTEDTENQWYDSWPSLGCHEAFWWFQLGVQRCLQPEMFCTDLEPLGDYLDSVPFSGCKGTQEGSLSTCQSMSLFFAGGSVQSSSCLKGSGFFSNKNPTITCLLCREWRKLLSLILQQGEL